MAVVYGATGKARKMNKLIRVMEREFHEIIVNIKTAAEESDITWQQRDELLRLVYTEQNQKLELAKNLLYDWTGSYYPGDRAPLT